MDISVGDVADEASGADAVEDNPVAQQDAEENVSAAEHDNSMAVHASDEGEDALSALVNQLMEEGGVESSSASEKEEGEEEYEDASTEDTPLIDACRHGRLDDVTSLIAAGDDVNEANADGSTTPLIVASEFGHAQTVEVLCAAGAALDQSNEDGDTALLLASEEGHTTTVSVLCAAGASVDHADTIGRTALFLAIDNGHLPVVQLLISHGASQTISMTRFDQQRTALAMAKKRGHADLAAWLKTIEQWSTPLHHLSGGTKIDAARARALLCGGASIHAAASTSGPTPLSLAEAMLTSGHATADDGSAAALVLQAARPWSRGTHALFPAEARAWAAELLVVGHRLSREPRFAEVAGALLDVWVGCVMPLAVLRGSKQ